MNKPLVLIIDDEPQMVKLLEITMHQNGYDTKSAYTGLEGLRLASSFQPDLVLLDLSLHDVSGQEVLLQLRSWCTKPIIILSVEDKEEEIVMALDHGANDYLTKPFRTGELLARIRLALRASHKQIDVQQLNVAGLHIDLIGRVVKRNGEVLNLTVTEYNLLILLAKYEGRVLTHQFLLKAIWGIAYQNETQYLRVFVAQLRKKIENDSYHPEHLKTVSGIGYRLE